MAYPNNILRTISPDTHNTHRERDTRDRSSYTLGKPHLLDRMSYLLAIDIVALCLKVQQCPLLVLAFPKSGREVDTITRYECEDGSVEEVGVAEASR